MYAKRLKATLNSPLNMLSANLMILLILVAAPGEQSPLLSADMP